jgi:hypothetical protein
VSYAVAYSLIVSLFPAAKEVASDGTADQALFPHLYNKVPNEPRFHEQMT